MNEETKPNHIDLTTADKKYRIIQDPNFNLKVLRYEQEWQDKTGDKLLLTLVYELQEAREQIKRLECRIANSD